MRTLKQLRAALQDLNLAEFCRLHNLPLRTVRRIKAGGVPRAGTAALIEAALDRKRFETLRAAMKPQARERAEASTRAMLAALNKRK